MSRRERRLRTPAPVPAAPGARPGGLRRRVATGVAVAAIAAALVWWQASPAFLLSPPSADRNVVLVTIDTLRADALGSYGGRARTPVLDALAASGARFTFAHAHAVMTLPSHTSMLTGRYPYEHGMRDNAGYRVPDGTVTLATRLRERGFATGAFIAAYPLTRRFGLAPAFDVYDDRVPESTGSLAFAMPERPAAEVVTAAVEWIGRQSSPFFAWVHVFEPHAPYLPAEPHLSANPGRAYDGEVAWVDEALGPLVERLQTIARPTTIIVTSDHGESLGDHGELTHGMFAYEATLRVPLIVAEAGAGAGARPRGWLGLGGRTRGVVIDAPVRHVDLLPTVLDVIGAPPDESLRGSSLRDLVRDGRGPDRPSYFEAMTYHLVRGWAPLRGVIVERRKFIDLPIPELYDLRGDPAEAKNQAAGEPARLDVLSRVLGGFDRSLPGRPGRETAAVAAELRALGYVSGPAPVRTVYTEDDDPKRLVDVDRDLQAAGEAYHRGRIDEAVALFTRVLDRRPDTADAWTGLAVAYWESGRPREAIDALERGLRSGAADYDIRIRLGLYLAESGVDPARAVRVLEGLPGSDTEVLNARGVALSAASRFAEAAAAFRALLALDETNGLALQNLGSVALSQAHAEGAPAERQRRLQEAEMLLRRALDRDPTLAKAHTTLGVALADTGRKADAIQSWTRAVELDPTEFDALYNLTVTLAEAGRVAEARDAARRFVATAPPARYAAEIERLRRFLGGS